MNLGSRKVQPIVRNAKKSSLDKECLKELLNLKDFSIKFFCEGTYFGEDEIIFGGKRRHNLRAVSDCDLMVMSRDSFEKIVQKEFPHIFNKLKNLAVQREENLDISKKRIFR